MVAVPVLFKFIQDAKDGLVVLVQHDGEYAGVRSVMDHQWKMSDPKMPSNPLRMDREVYSNCWSCEVCGLSFNLFAKPVARNGALHLAVERDHVIQTPFSADCSEELVHGVLAS